MPAGDQQPIELLADREAWAREPVRIAEELGHTVVKDGAARHTCTACDRAVLVCGTNIYGSATEEWCTPGRSVYTRPDHTGPNPGVVAAGLALVGKMAGRYPDNFGQRRAWP